MKKVILLMLAPALLSGCASVDPSKVSLAVAPTTTVCGANDRKVPVVLNITNGSRGVLRIGVSSHAGPPFEMSWLYYEVRKPGAGDVVDLDHGPGDHGPLPSSTLRIGPGDATSISANVYQIKSEDYANRFMIRFEDLDENVYTTEAFLPCIRPAPPT